MRHARTSSPPRGRPREAPRDSATLLATVRDLGLPLQTLLSLPPFILQASGRRNLLQKASPALLAPGHEPPRLSSRFSDSSSSVGSASSPPALSPASVSGESSTSIQAVIEETPVPVFTVSRTTTTRLTIFERRALLRASEASRMDCDDVLAPPLDASPLRSSIVTEPELRKPKRMRTSDDVPYPLPIPPLDNDCDTFLDHSAEFLTAQAPCPPRPEKDGNLISEPSDVGNYLIQVQEDAQALT